MNGFEIREAERRTKAMNYLRAKFPSTDEQIFRTDYTGEIHDDVIDLMSVVQSAEIDAACETCTGTCRLESRSSRPIVKISESAKGFRFLSVGWTCGVPCKFSSSCNEMFSKSGITNADMTFKNYICSKNYPETRTAMIEAMNASRENTCLILAGKPGTGKTHLAVAIAICAIEQGHQAIFRLVSAMLDEIQAAIRDNRDYDGLMRKFKTVPCLVLDDIGHENMTPARASYLHQIIDYRYGRKLQTIITTNAKDIAGLCAIDREEYIMPIISRVLSNGKWVTLTNAPDRRLNHE